LDQNGKLRSFNATSARLSSADILLPTGTASENCSEVAIAPLPAIPAIGVVFVGELRVPKSRTLQQAALVLSAGVTLHC
jgi:hypothetical protein